LNRVFFCKNLKKNELLPLTLLKIVLKQK